MTMSHSFFFNDTATTEIYTLSLHDALPISYTTAQSPAACILHPRTANAYTVGPSPAPGSVRCLQLLGRTWLAPIPERDRKSTRLNSSHGYISYAVFCLNKK